MYDDLFDPPADPFGDERWCRICDASMQYDPWTKEYYCDEHECVLIICINPDCTFEYDGSTKEADGDWTIACPECGCDVKVVEYNLED